MATRWMELLRVGTDSGGDEVTLEALERMVAEFVPGIPVTVGFGKTGPTVGVVLGLRLKGDKSAMEAVVELDVDGETAVGNGMELAAGGTAEVGEGAAVITEMKLTGAALTNDKVK